MINLEIDRLVTVYFVHPLIQLISRQKRVHIPILMYHSVSDSRDKYLNSYYHTTTYPRVFAEQMKFLHENKYTVINLDDIQRCLMSPENKDNKYVIITFDDGYRDFYLSAFPILHKYGFSATVFLSTGFINNKNLTFKDKECLNWNEVCELRETGVIFGSHTVTHPQLWFLKRHDVENELRQSKEAIEDRIGERVESFSYPFAFPEEDREFKTFLRHMLETCGYRNGVSTRIGTAGENDDIFFLKRVPINSADDLSFFRTKLEGGYDWLYTPQYLFKLAKKKVAARSRAHREGRGYGT